LTGFVVAEGGFVVDTADISEMFQYEDFNINNEDRKGLFVSLVNDGKIEIGSSNIIGVVSINPGYIGDSAELKWQNTFMRDIWNSKIYDKYKVYKWTEKNKTYTIFEDADGKRFEKYPQPSCLKGIDYIGHISTSATTTYFNVQRLNPDYDNKKTYVPRSGRQEWTPVALLGKILVKSSEEITGRFIDVDSKGMAINGNKYNVLKTVKSYQSPYGIVQILFK
jgi:hypothetical protein